MLHAIERLTNLYDLSKAFGSTIDIDELSDAHRPQGRRLRDAPRSPPSGCSTGEDVDARGAPPSTRTTTSSPRPTPSALGRRRRRRRPGRPSGETASRRPTRWPRRTTGYPIRSVLAVPARRGRGRRSAPSSSSTSAAAIPSSRREDEELLADLARQAVRALRNARQHEAEKKVEELDALLAVSREITSTLDLDKVMQTIVNAHVGADPLRPLRASRSWRGASCASGAVSGAAEVDRKDPDVRRDGGAAPVGVPLGHRRRRHPARGRRDRGRPARDRGEVPRALPGDGPALVLRRRCSRTRRASSARSASRARSRSSSTRGRATCCRSSSTRRPSPSATPSSTSRCRWPASRSRCSRGGAGCSTIPQRRRLAWAHRRSRRGARRSSSCPGRCASAGRRASCPGAGRP